MTPVTVVAKGVNGNKFAADNNFEASTAHVTTHDVAQVQSASKGIFVDLGLSQSLSLASAHCVCFPVDSGSSCNTIHVTDLKKMAAVKVTPSSVRLLDYSKTIIIIIFFIFNFFNIFYLHFAIYTKRKNYCTVKEKKKYKKTVKKENQEPKDYKVKLHLHLQYRN